MEKQHRWIKSLGFLSLVILLVVGCATAPAPKSDLPPPKIANFKFSEPSIYYGGKPIILSFDYENADGGIKEIVVESSWAGHTHRPHFDPQVNEALKRNRERYRVSQGRFEASVTYPTGWVGDHIERLYIVDGIGRKSNALETHLCINKDCPPQK